MKILTAAEMRETDRLTIERGMTSATLPSATQPSNALMENAGRAVASFVQRQHGAWSCVTVLCGKGNNGGDGCVAARLLAEHGWVVTLLLLCQPDSLAGDAATMFTRFREDAPYAKLVIADSEAALDGEEAGEAFASAELFLDAVLGTGFKPPLRGVAVAVREKLATLKTPVIAVDLPSGWDADSMEQSSPDAFRASAVVTFTAPKLAHVFGHLTSPDAAGAVVVAPIGSPEDTIRSATGVVWSGSSKAVAEAPRPINSNKGKFGHALLIGGAWGKAGAPSMAALAALRAGAGLVTAAVPLSIVNTVARVAPELMIHPLDETPRDGARGGSVSRANLNPTNLDAMLKKITVLAIGPGLSTEPEAAEFARGIVQRTKLPIVLDADALNAFEGRAHELNGSGRTMVLTPHPGEMARLTGLTVKEVEADRVGLARSFATEHHLTLVLKGWRTLVAHPDGTIAVNTTGNPSMAKGGSGDILTGIIAAMLAQFPHQVADAVNAAVYLHGLAADFAVRDQEEHTVLATDTVAHLWRAFRARVNDEDGLTWICGLASAR